MLTLRVFSTGHAFLCVGVKPKLWVIAVHNPPRISYKPHGVNLSGSFWAHNQPLNLVTILFCLARFGQISRLLRARCRYYYLMTLKSPNPPLINEYSLEFLGVSPPERIYIILKATQPEVDNTAKKIMLSLFLRPSATLSAYRTKQLCFCVYMNCSVSNA